MASISLWKILFAVVVLAMGSHAGQIPSCQQQLVAAFIKQFDPSVLTPTCLKQTFSNTDLGELNVSALLNGGYCADLISNQQSIANIIEPIVRSNTTICGVGFNPIHLGNANLSLNILGLNGLTVTVRDASVTSLPTLIAVASLYNPSPLTVGINADAPLLIRAKVGARVPVGQSVPSLPVNADVAIHVRIKITLRIAIESGAVNMSLAGPTVCAVEDIDYPVDCALGVSEQGTTFSVVSTVAIGLADAVAVLVGHFAATLIKISTGIALGITND